MTSEQDRQQSWSHYWQSGALHSCVGSFADNYAGAIAEFWRGIACAQRADARVLDIATGNGALPRLLLESTAATHALAIDAIDLAQLAPAWPAALTDAARARLHWHCGVRAEALPFADASFDLIVSQYGLEYTDLGRSVAEIKRVMTANATIALVLHHVDSLPVRKGRVEIAELDWLLDAHGLIERARRLLPHMARLGTPEGLARVRSDPAAAQCRGDFNGAMRELEARIDADSERAAVLREAQTSIGQLVSSAPQIGLGAASSALDTCAAQLREARLRQAELVGCALDAAAVQALAASLAKGLPFEAEVGSVGVDGHLFGWTLVLGPRLPLLPTPPGREHGG